MKQSDVTRTVHRIVERARRHYKGEPEGILSTLPLTHHAAERGEKSIVYCTKPLILFNYATTARIVTRHCSIFGKYGIPALAQIRIVAEETGRTNRAVAFVGDLDPLDLTIWRLWSSELVGKAHNQQWRYVGIDDESLARIEKLGASYESSWLRMTRGEMRHVNELLSSPNDWADILGPKCLTRLTEGWKLELEGFLALLCANEAGCQWWAKRLIGAANLVGSRVAESRSRGRRRHS
jgi:hypothetical protein